MRHKSAWNKYSNALFPDACTACSSRKSLLLAFLHVVLFLQNPFTHTMGSQSVNSLQNLVLCVSCAQSTRPCVESMFLVPVVSRDTNSGVCGMMFDMAVHGVAMCLLLE